MLESYIILFFFFFCKPETWFVFSLFKHTRQAQAFNWCEKCILDSNSEVVCLPRCMCVLSSPCYPYGFLQVMVRSLPSWSGKVSKEGLRELQKVTGSSVTFSTILQRISAVYSLLLSWLQEDFLSLMPVNSTHSSQNVKVLLKVHRYALCNG